MARTKNTLNRKLELLDQLRRSRSEMAQGREALSQSIKKPIEMAKLPKKMASSLFSSVKSLGNSPTEVSSSPNPLVWKSFAGALVLGLLLRGRRRSKKHPDNRTKKESRSFLSAAFLGIAKPMIRSFLLKQVKNYTVHKAIPSMVSKYEIGRSE